MSLQVQMGPPGTLGASQIGVGHATPAPQDQQQGGGAYSSQSIGSPNATDEGDVIMMKPDMAAMKRFKSLRELAPDSPAMVLLQDTIVLAIDLFKLSMASMLSVFVPQLCPASDAGYVTRPTVAPTDPNYTVNEIANAVGQYARFRSDGCSHDTVAHDCTFGENFVCLSPFNKFVLAWNFICLAILIFHYFLVWRREHFLINNFKETLTLGRLHVRDIISDYPSVQIMLRKYNSWVFNASVIVIIMQVVNLITSGILLFAYFNSGYKTFTTYFTNLLLISLVLYNCISAAYVGLKHELAYSCVGCQ